MSDLELLADTMEEWSTTSGDHHMLAAAAIRQLIKLEAALQSGEEVVPAEWINRLDEALDLTYLADIRPARSCILQLRKAMQPAGKGGEE
jgi:hypothetical protein